MTYHSPIDYFTTLFVAVSYYTVGKNLQDSKAGEGKIKLKYREEYFL